MGQTTYILLKGKTSLAVNHASLFYICPNIKALLQQHVTTVCYVLLLQRHLCQDNENVGLDLILPNTANLSSVENIIQLVHVVVPV